jgi:hypothetical protein
MKLGDVELDRLNHYDGVGDSILGWGIDLSSTGGTPGWRLGSNHTAQQWKNKCSKRGWTDEQITEAILSGPRFPTANNVNPGNSATRYLHPETGRPIVLDDVTQEVIHVGGDGFVY